MGFYFTSESVSEGHPDKVADQISDALLDEFLRYDPESKVACETFVTTGLVVCGGEVKTDCYVDHQRIVRDTIRKIGYTKAEYRFDSDSCGIISTIHEQSPDINQGVVRDIPESQGAGDQGMMFGYACREMENFMPIPIELAHMLVQFLADIRKEGKVMTYLRPDSKSQVTIEYDEKFNALRLATIVLSTQHDEFVLAENQTAEARKNAEKQMQDTIAADVRKYLIPRVLNDPEVPQKVKDLFSNGFELLINPTGKFIIGGPHGDTGLTGRKIIVDTYGGRAQHGGGAFSGKDASKVDRSAAYATRHMAKNLVAAGVCDECLVQVAYAIGKAEPVSLFINTFGTSKVKDDNGISIPDDKIAEIAGEIFDMRPYAIIKRLGLKNPIFNPTASYGHFGRDAFEEEVEVFYKNSDTYEKLINGETKIFKKVIFFAWEQLNYIDQVKRAFKM